MSQVRTPDAATVPLPLRSVLPAFGLDVGIAMALSVSIMMAGLFGWAAWCCTCAAARQRPNGVDPPSGCAGLLLGFGRQVRDWRPSSSVRS